MLVKPNLRALYVRCLLVEGGQFKCFLFHLIMPYFIAILFYSLLVLIIFLIPIVFIALDLESFSMQKINFYYRDKFIVVFIVFFIWALIEGTMQLKGFYKLLSLNGIRYFEYKAMSNKKKKMIFEKALNIQFKENA